MYICILIFTCTRKYLHTHVYICKQHIQNAPIDSTLSFLRRVVGLFGSRVLLTGMCVCMKIYIYVEACVHVYSHISV